MMSNMPKSRAQGTWMQLMLLLLYLLAAVCFATAYFRMAMVYDRASPERLVSFTAATPFQYRVLVPAIAHVIQRVAPVAPTSDLFFVLTIIIVFATLIVWAAYLSDFMPPGIANSGAFLILYPLFWNYCQLRSFLYVSDLAAVLFFAAGLICLRKDKMLAYYGVFLLATFNRETSCFLTLAFLFVNMGRKSWKCLASHTLAQFAIWIGIKLVLSHVFAANGGEAVFELKLSSNIRALLDPVHVAWTQITFSFGCLWLLIPFGWRRTPSFMKRQFWIVPPVLAGMLVVANVFEVRVFAELIPVITGPAVFGLWRVAERTRWE